MSKKEISNFQKINFSKPYNHKIISEGIYDEWTNKKLFTPNYEKPLYSCVMAPPNLTGILHIGHAWELSIADAYLRMKKMNGFNVSWAPGYDHAGISTQVKFEKSLTSDEHKKYFSLSRKGKIKWIEKWSIKNSSKIIEQMKLIGVSSDWDNFHFTLDKNSDIAVKKAFKILYDKKFIYQEEKIVNWDINLKTAISDIEVQNKPTEQYMYYVSYEVKNTKEKLVVATTRPETIFVDSALFVNPNDKRYKKYINSEAINPLTGEFIKILSDSYVDIKFGTGVMKCTPAHDINDYKLGKKYKLRQKSCIDFDGKLNECAGKFAGIDRIESRELIANELKTKNKLLKTEKIISNVGYSERSNAIVEPLLSKQWFIKLSSFSSKLKKSIESSRNFKIVPKKFLNLLNQWLNTCEDWCISRQLVWGHQIPVWYHKKTKKIYVDVIPPKDIKNYYQDNDVLDTWFSSSLWPMICYGWPKTDSSLFKNGYPNSLMIMGFDILFFWGIRMMFQGMFHTNKLPFNILLIHGLIRDKDGRKMSKSLGNVIDPIEIINKYGADALRIYLTSNTSLGEDTNYQENKLKEASNFLNKLWNAANYILSFLNSNKINNTFTNKFDVKDLNELDKWILIKFDKTLIKVSKLLDNFEFSLANLYLYNFIWNDFCNTYLEFCKPILKTNNKKNTLKILKYLFLQILHLLHPFAPFITDRIYQALINDSKKYLLSNEWPKPLGIKLNSNFDKVIEIITIIRNFKNETKMLNKDILKIDIVSTNKKLTNLFKNSSLYLSLVGCELKNVLDSKPINFSGKSLVGSDFELLIDSKLFNNKIEEILMKKIEKLKFEVERSKKILSNKQFVKNAPIEKVNAEKDKLKNYELELEKALKEFKK
ncbi:valine--tRNA ligase [Mycoplasmoides alvi]|uniref:valine--tRNA ligase n=1 Tax=Mycoplasmoides alvi TaxID=78580 RepID=UPI000698FCAB|nr:valine--tRNA ligase [Mycoplasmoides alvi]